MTDPPPSAGPSVADPGASAERTRLAWRRTVLSAAGVGLLAARLSVELLDDRAAVLGGVFAGVALLGWVIFAALAARRMRTLARGRAALDPTLTGGGTATDRVALLICAAGAAGSAVFGVGLVLVALA